jgi:heme/copper-type cytochrome/quinol oxidase subunit 3
LTFAQAVRAPQARRVQHRRHRQAAPHHRAATRQGRSASWEIRSFLLASGVIFACFLLALLYLAQATAVSAAGYEAQRLAAQRDELRRQNALLIIESARLDSPARVEAEAQRLGLVRAATIRVVGPEAVAAAR